MKLTEYDKARIRYYSQEEGLSLRQIADKIGCGWTSVHWVLRPEAKAAHRVISDQWKKDNPDKYLKSILISQAKRRAEESKVPFDKTFLDFMGDFPSHCPACDVVMQRGSGKLQPNSPSIDRISPELGYVPGNVQWLCQSCNCTKSNRGMEYLLEKLG